MHLRAAEQLPILKGRRLRSRPLLWCAVPNIWAAPLYGAKGLADNMLYPQSGQRTPTILIVEVKDCGP